MNFYFLVGCLVVLAILIVVWPLLRKPDDSEDDSDNRTQQNIEIAREKKKQLDMQRETAALTEEEYLSALTDLETALAIDIEKQDKQHMRTNKGRWMALVMAIAVPLSSAWFYFQFGALQVIKNPELADVAKPQQHPVQPQMTLEEMLVAIKEKLKDNPNDPRGWFALGKALMADEQFDEAVSAFRRTNELAPDQPGVIFSLADSIAMAAGSKIGTETYELVERGLEIAPNDPSGLWLGGLAAEQRGELAKAHQYWTRLLPQVAQDPQTSLDVKNLLAGLEQRDPSLKPAPNESSEATGLTLNVQVNELLADSISPDDSVFIYAKAMQGPPMPLAVKRMTVADLPVTVKLSDADAMIPSMKLSSFDRIVVGARISKSGQPIAQPGDFYIEMDNIDRMNASDVIGLTISETR